MTRVRPGECAVVAALFGGIMDMNAGASVALVVGAYMLAWSITQLIGPSFEEQFAQWAAAIEHDHSNVRSDRYRSTR